MKIIVIIESIIIIALIVTLANVKRDITIVREYVHELEEAVEDNGDCIADISDKCTDYYKAWGD